MAASTPVDSPALPLPPSLPPSGAVPDFADLGLHEASLLRAAAAAGWLRPSAVQVAVIPAVLQGRDVQAQAPTGAGKTAAYLLPLLQALLGAGARDALSPRRLRTLVLVPTRELATQIGAAAHVLAPSLKTVVVVGGLSINPQMLALRGGADLLVATPGRLLDLSRCNALHLRDLQVLVLDEADRLLDDSYAEETRRVIQLAPRQRQTLLFSATLGEAAHSLGRLAQREPLVLSGSAEPAAAGQAAPEAHADIRQRAIVVDTARRTALLKQLLRTEAWERALVFVASQHGAEHLADKLRQDSLAAAALHGDLSAGRRAQVLTDLRSGRLRVLVATDLAARGIDVPSLPVVVSYDLPRSAVTHTHRIGRTGRAGRAGLAVSFIAADAPGSEAHFRLIEKRQALRVPRECIAGFEPAAAPAPLPADPTGGVKGQRRSRKDKLRQAAAEAAVAVRRHGP